jgi:hypothetical protein
MAFLVAEEVSIDICFSAFAAVAKSKKLDGNT